MEKISPVVIISCYHNIYKNLAIEELLLNKCSDKMVILFLWQNEDCVVIGSNQNVFTECNVEKLREDNIPVARRKTGGGAVWHDMKNINFSFISGNKLYDEKRQSGVIIKALEKLSLFPSLTGRNDIEVEGYKVSGNAYLHGKNTSLHHGTLLIDVSLEKLSSYLTPSINKLKKKGVKSVKSRVKNLIEFNKNINVNNVINSLKSSFCDEYGAYKEEKISQFISEKELEEKKREYSSEEYIFKKNNRFSSLLNGSFNWGECQIELNFNGENKIDVFNVYSDCLASDISSFLNDYFMGKTLEEIKKECDFKRELSKEKVEIISDIKSLVLKEFN